MAYFNYFPSISYDVRGDIKNPRIQSITNVLQRVRKKMNVINASFFEQYFITDGDKPETLAHMIYGDSTLHWIILYANYMTNPYYDWPLTYYDLQKFIDKKYPNNRNGIHHYEDEMGYIVDLPEDYNPDSQYPKIITNFLYEEELNDSKRTVNIIREEYVQQIIQEFKSIMSR
jgi:hypothetical protein